MEAPQNEQLSCQQVRGGGGQPIAFGRRLRSIETSLCFKTVAIFNHLPCLVVPVSLNTLVEPYWNIFVIEKLAKVELGVIFDPKKLEAVSYWWRSLV